jgi:hypothetical protein
MVFIVALGCSLWAMDAAAGTFTVANDTALVAYSGTLPAQYFAGSNPFVGTTGIGPGFDTSVLTVSMSSSGRGTDILTFSYLTQFSGAETLDGMAIAAADLFLTPPGGGTYGVSLGGQTSNGGLAPGFYEVQSSETSEQIWSGRPGYIYGGAIAPSTSYQPGQAGFTDAAVPTVITSGRYMGAAAISTTSGGGGLYTWNISMEMSVAEAGMFDHGFDVFWGTADCANGAFEANVPAFAVAEPGSLPVFCAALGGLVVLRRRYSQHHNTGRRGD